MHLIEEGASVVAVLKYISRDFSQNGDLNACLSGKCCRMDRRE